MNDRDLSRRFAYAEALVREAGALALTMQRAPADAGVEMKGVRDFATAADKAVEELIVARLTKEFGDSVLGEEFGGSSSMDLLWIVDPIDGTYNYFHRNPRWCVSLGLMVDGRMELGLIFAPQSNDVYLARRSHGATRNGQRLAVSHKAYDAAPLVEVGCSTKRPLDLYIDLVRTVMTNGIETRRSGSGSLGVAQVATGEIDGYVERYINSWDVAAALLMVTEAGGVVSDFFEGSALTEGNHMLAAAPWLAPRLTELTGIPTMQVG